MTAQGFYSSYQHDPLISNVECSPCPKLLFFAERNKQRGGMFFKPPCLKLQSKSTSFTPKFGSDAFSSPPTSVPPVLCIHNDRTPEHLKLSSCKIRHKTRQWLWTSLPKSLWKYSLLSHLSATFSRTTAITATDVRLLSYCFLLTLI